jgi:hypothetical protein
MPRTFTEVVRSLPNAAVAAETIGWENVIRMVRERLRFTEIKGEGERVEDNRAAFRAAYILYRAAGSGERPSPEVYRERGVALRSDRHPVGAMTVTVIARMAGQVDIGTEWDVDEYLGHAALDHAIVAQVLGLPMNEVYRLMASLERMQARANARRAYVNDGLDAFYGV